MSPHLDIIHELIAGLLCHHMNNWYQILRRLTTDLIFFGFSKGIFMVNYWAIPIMSLSTTTFTSKKLRTVQVFWVEISSINLNLSRRVFRFNECLCVIHKF